MLDGYGLHRLIWNRVDQRFAPVMLASPADAEGRGIALEVRRDGRPADLTGATAYLVWRHRSTMRRGTMAFEAVDDSSGRFAVHYPAVMCACGGAVDCQIMLSLGDERYLSSLVFTVRVEPVLVGEGGPEDGFTIFVGAINAYENAEDICTDAAFAANAAAELADQARVDLLAAAERGDFDGADGVDGVDGTDGVDGQDGFSPSVSVTTITGGHRVSVTDADGTETFDVMDGADGSDGAPGADGQDGVSCTHSWSGTVLSVTSASGTSSADLKGATGATGADGTDGVSPSVSVTSITGGHRVSVTDATQTQTFDVMDGAAGQNGTNGTNGTDGVSPSVSVTTITGGHTVSITDAIQTQSFNVMDGVDGDDYVLTNQDKSDIATLVAAMFTTGDSQSY